ncbi:Proprotein convertase subtilisin/kexin type 6 [Schistosoma haematobium]|uniref:Proprotein convertase subtilisin/kexin type 6 n=1 Tax=Schistosoma haematobium TaxID=6185 RepID=A0A922S7C2_SCHHA|nr:Proprotein convertase subtilisin/kexin type 6 [Schistosoma haematobium]KAH9596570.1 Proprotein convertase subtilisin/kexin type 6 [Schistosoma haematobium]
MNCGNYLHFLLVISLCHTVMNQLYCRQNSCEMPSVEYVVRVDGTFSDAKAVARLHDLELVDEMIGFKGMYIMHSKASALKRRKRRAMVSIGGPGVKWFIKQEFLKRTKRSSVPTVFWDDPLYPDMWYLGLQFYVFKPLLELCGNSKLIVRWGSTSGFQMWFIDIKQRDSHVDPPDIWMYKFTRQ